MEHLWKNNDREEWRYLDYHPSQHKFIHHGSHTDLSVTQWLVVIFLIY